MPRPETPPRTRPGHRPRHVRPGQRDPNTAGLKIIFFSIIQRKVIKPSDLGDATALAARLTRFQARYNITARPFDWTFTRAGLNDLCRRIDARRSHGSVSLAA
jgi:hypothetical protein